MGSSEEGHQEVGRSCKVKIPEAPSQPVKLLRIACRGKNGKAICKPKLKSSGKVGECPERGGRGVGADAGRQQESCSLEGPG